MKKYLMAVAVLALGSWGVFAADKTAEVKAAGEVKEEKAQGAVKLTEKNFDATIKSGVVLVDFWATWCPPCRKQGPILDEVAKAVGDKAVVAKLDVDQYRKIATKYKIRSLPTLMVFKDGEVKQTLVGIHQKDQLIKLIDKHRK